MDPEPDDLQTPPDDVDLDEGADPGTPPDGDDEPDAGTPPDGDDETPEARNWRSLQEKYPGKTDAEIQAIVSEKYWEQTRALSQAAKERRDLELRFARLEGRLEAASGPPPDKEPPPPPPEIQELDTYITGLNQEDADVSTRQTDLLKELGDARDRAGELRGQIAAAKARGEEETTVPILEARLELAQQSVKSIQATLHSTVRERKHITWNRQRAEKEKAWLQRLHTEGEAREASEREELEAALAEIPKRVDGVIAAAIGDKAHAVPNDAAIREDLRDYVRDKITIDLWRLGHNVPITKVPLQELVGKHVQKYMSGRGLAKRAVFAQRSRDKTAVAGQPPASGKESTAPGRKSSVVSASGTLPAGMLRARRLLAQRGW